MSPSTSSTIRAVDDESRHWVVVHDGQLHAVSWDDGERLLSLSHRIRIGETEPQNFTFRPQGSALGDEAATIFVSPETPIDLMTEYDCSQLPHAELPHAELPQQSHWWG